MSIENALVAAVTEDATVSALIGDRFFPAGGRQGSGYPYVTYQQISWMGAPHLTGPSNLDWPRYQFDIWGETKLQANAAAEAIRTFLDRIERSGAGMTFEASFQDQRSEVDETTRNHRVSQDYLITHER